MNKYQRNTVAGRDQIFESDIVYRTHASQEIDRPNIRMIETVYLELERDRLTVKPREGR
jgi:hypothetical protein